MRSLSLFNSRPTFFDLISQSDDLFKDGNRWPSAFSRSYPTTSSDFAPNVDIHEADGAYLVHADLPGLKKENVKVELNENVLTISGERNIETKGEGKYVEREYGKFTRSFRLPLPVEDGAVQAKFEDGVLEIKIPQAASKKAKTIEIQ